MINTFDGPAVLVRALRVRRGQSIALDGVDLTVDRGQAIAIRGRSGAGKSTLLAVVAGLTDVESGEVFVAGQALTGASERVRSTARLRSVGMAFQSDELIPELTLGENVSLPLLLNRRGLSSKGVRMRVGDTLERLGIHDLIDRRPAEVSGGQLQRAAIARAIIHGPAVVLADEPTGALDEAAAQSAARLLVDTARERDAAVLLVTHDAEVAQACDRTVILHTGRIFDRTNEPEVLSD